MIFINGVKELDGLKTALNFRFFLRQDAAESTWAVVHDQHKQLRKFVLYNMLFLSVFSLIWDLWPYDIER